jgi:hypothetical protein
VKKIATILAVVLAVIIVVLLGLLIFVKPVQGPTISRAENLQVDLPQPNAVVSSPVAIEGSVTGGGWFFEGSFPVKVLSGDGKVIGTGTAQALSDWTSTGTVPFSASVLFTAPSSSYGVTGTILFANDNPSGLPGSAKSFSVPIRFK